LKNKYIVIINFKLLFSNSGEDLEQLITVPTPTTIHHDHKNVLRNSSSNANIKSYTNSTPSANRYSYVPVINKSDQFNTSNEDLNDVNWYHPNMPRENVQNYLANREIGSFIIRLSNTCKDCFALSIRVPYFANQNGIAHYLIIKNTKGYKLKGVDKEFKSLKSLITHYSVMQEILPVTLNINLSTSLCSNNNHKIIKKNENNQIGILSK
jgi:hypothetical protein